MEEVFWWIPVAKMSLSISNFAAEIFSNNRGISLYHLQYTKHIKTRIYPITVEFVSKRPTRMLSANSQFEPAFVVLFILSFREVAEQPIYVRSGSFAADTFAS